MKRIKKALAALYSLILERGARVPILSHVGQERRSLPQE